MSETTTNPSGPNTSPSTNSDWSGLPHYYSPTKFERLSENARRLFEVLKEYNGRQIPPVEDLQAKMDGLHILPLTSCLKHLVEAGFVEFSEPVEAS